MRSDLAPGQLPGAALRPRSNALVVFELHGHSSFSLIFEEENEISGRENSNDKRFIRFMQFSNTVCTNLFWFGKTVKLFVC